MTTGTRRSALGTRAVLFAVAIVVGFSSAAEAQWPTVVMFYGGDLKEPVFATGADTVPFAAFVGTAKPGQPTAEAMASRSYIGVAFFWGPRDQPAMNGVRNLADLTPEMSFNHGRLYPPAADKPAALFMTSLVQLKGRDVFGMRKIGPGPAKTLIGRPVPSDPALFSFGGDIPPQALSVLKRLGALR